MIVDYFQLGQIFNDIVFKYSSLFGYDLSYMKCLLSEKPRYDDGTISKEISSEEFGGCWTNNRTIYVNPYPEKVIKHWKLDMSEEDFLRWIIAHELAHEIWKNQSTESSRNEIVDLAKKEKFSSKYLKKVSKEKKDEETFCEFLASLLGVTTSK